MLNLWSDALQQVSKETWQNCIKHVENLIQEAFITEQVIDEVRPLIISAEENCSNSDSDFSDDE